MLQHCPLFFLYSSRLPFGVKKNMKEVFWRKEKNRKDKNKNKHFCRQFRFCLDLLRWDENDVGDDDNDVGDDDNDMNGDEDDVGDNVRQQQHQQWKW